MRLNLVLLPDGQRLIKFGEVPYGMLCLDPADGRVVDVVVDRDGHVVRGPVLVNSSLDQHVATVEQATACFPYDDGSEESDFSVIADDLRAHLAPIDPAAWEVDGYWDTFYWDVTVGDYRSILFRLGDTDK